METKIRTEKELLQDELNSCNKILSKYENNLINSQPNSRLNRILKTIVSGIHYTIRIKEIKIKNIENEK